MEYWRWIMETLEVKWSELARIEEFIHIFQFFSYLSLASLFASLVRVKKWRIFVMYERFKYMGILEIWICDIMGFSYVATTVLGIWTEIMFIRCQLAHWWHWWHFIRTMQYVCWRWIAWIHIYHVNLDDSWCC